MMAFFLTIPINKIMPMTAMRLMSMRANHKASNAPSVADGKVDKIVIGCT